MKTRIQLPPSLKKALEHNEQLYWKPLYHTDQYPTELPSYASMIHSALAVAMPRVDVLAFNRVIGLGMSDQPMAQQLEDIIRFYEKAGVSRFFSQISPFFLTPTLESSLERYGFQYYNRWVKLVRKASSPIPKVETQLVLFQVLNNG